MGARAALLSSVWTSVFDAVKGRRGRRAGAGGGGPVVYDEDAQAYFDAMGAGHQPDAAHKGLINSAIVAMKAAGVFTKLDWLLIPGPDMTASLVNMAHPSKSATVAGTVALDPYHAFQPDGTTGELDFGEAFNAAGNHFSQNSATIGTWFVGGTPSTTGYGICNITSSAVRITQSLATQIITALNGVQQPTYLTAGNHHYTVTRNSSDTAMIYVDGAFVVNDGKVSATVSGGHAGAFAINSNYSAEFASLIYSGAGFTAGEIAALDDCWRTYFTDLAALESGEEPGGGGGDPPTLDAAPLVGLDPSSPIWYNDYDALNNLAAMGGRSTVVSGVKRLVTNDPAAGDPIIDDNGDILRVPAGGQVNVSWAPPWPYDPDKAHTYIRVELSAPNCVFNSPGGSVINVGDIITVDGVTRCDLEFDWSTMPIVDGRPDPQRMSNSTAAIAITSLGDATGPVHVTVAEIDAIGGNWVDTGVYKPGWLDRDMQFDEWRFMDQLETNANDALLLPTTNATWTPWAPGASRPANSGNIQATITFGDITLMAGSTYADMATAQLLIDPALGCPFAPYGAVGNLGNKLKVGIAEASGATLTTSFDAATMTLMITPAAGRTTAAELETDLSSLPKSDIAWQLLNLYTGSIQVGENTGVVPVTPATNLSGGESRQYVGGWSYKHCVDALNVASTRKGKAISGYYHIPWNADDAFVTAMVGYIAENAPADSRSSFAIGNELWNSHFGNSYMNMATYAYCQDVYGIGKSLGSTNYGAPSKLIQAFLLDRWRAWHQIIADAFAPYAADGKTFRRVAEHQIGNVSNLLNTWSTLDANYLDYFDQTATAVYLKGAGLLGVTNAEKVWTPTLPMMTGQLILNGQDLWFCKSGTATDPFISTTAPAEGADFTVPTPDLLEQYILAYAGFNTFTTYSYLDADGNAADASKGRPPASIKTTTGNASPLARFQNDAVAAKGVGKQHRVYESGPNWLFGTSTGGQAIGRAMMESDAYERIMRSFYTTIRSILTANQVAGDVGTIQWFGETTGADNTNPWALVRYPGQPDSTNPRMRVAKAMLAGELG